MSTAKHTPGPWIVDTDPAYPGELSIDAMVDGWTYHIALVHQGAPPSDDSGLANANVMAAGPELLAAARLAEAIFTKQKWLPVEGSTDPEAVALRELRAAIKKAEGRKS